MSEIYYEKKSVNFVNRIYEPLAAKISAPYTYSIDADDGICFIAIPKTYLVAGSAASQILTIEASSAGTNIGIPIFGSSYTASHDLFLSIYVDASGNCSCENTELKFTSSVMSIMKEINTSNIRAVYKPLSATISTNTTKTISDGEGIYKMVIPAAYLKAGTTASVLLTIQSNVSSTSTVIIPIAGSGDTITCGGLSVDLYIDSSGNVYSDDWSISGSNSNGSYNKEASGKLNQWGISSTLVDLGINTVTTNPTVTFYHSSSQAQNFPVSFIDTNAVVNYNSGQASYPNIFYAHSVTATKFDYYLWSLIAGDAESTGIKWMATGRWK